MGIAPASDDWFTLKDAARRWHLKSPDNLRMRLARGTLTAQKIGPVWVVHRAEMERVYGPEPQEETAQAPHP